MKVNLLSKNVFPNSCRVRNFFSNIFRKSDEVTDLIENAGYKGERHKIKTTDGYHLTVHRIFPNKNTQPKGTIFLMHGLFRNSADFIATGPKIALPYLLSDHGYDCFLGNARGTKYCTKHETFHYQSKDFWNFSFEQIGLYDLPAMIEFAIAKSNSSKVNYVGHSQGCTSVLTLLASRPEYNKLISQLHLLAPAVFIDGATSFAFNFVNRILFKKFSKRYYKFNIAPVLKLTNKLSDYSKENPDIMLKLYKSITCKYVGRNKGEIQLSLNAIKAFNHFMSPTVGILQMEHFLQLYKSGKFQRFDHGLNNEMYYGTTTPPEYNLSNVITPTYLYHAEEDTLVIKTGMDRLSHVLPNVQTYKIVPDFNHIDVMLGRDSRNLLYNDILKYLIK